MRPQPLWQRCALRVLDYAEAVPVRLLPWAVFAAALVIGGLVDASRRSSEAVLFAAAAVAARLFYGSERGNRERALALCGLVGGALFYAGEAGPRLVGRASAARALAALLPAPAPPAAELENALHVAAWLGLLATSIAANTRIFPMQLAQGDVGEGVAGGAAASSSAAAAAAAAGGGAAHEKKS